MVNGTRVVVTGTGAITSLGHTTRETWEAVKAGRSGTRRVQAFDPSATPSQVASEVVDFKPETRLDRKEARRMSRFVQFAMVATKEALEESGLHITEANRDQVGVLVGSAIGGLEQIEEAHTILKERGPSRVSPFTVPMMIAGILVLEELESAVKRGAPILAEVVGYAATADASHITAPDPVGAGAAQAMKRTLEKARVAPADISYINAHGTATQLGDVAETLAV